MDSTGPRKLVRPTRQPIDAQRSQPVTQQPLLPMQESLIYTEDTVRNILAEGYISVHHQLWDHLPAGSHVRYFKKGTGPRPSRFKPGGFVQSHFTTIEGRKMMMLGTLSGDKRAGNITFPVAYDEIDEVWKKYEQDSFIEIHLICCSLAQKKQQIEDLERTIDEQTRELADVTARVATLENILRAVIKK